MRAAQGERGGRPLGARGGAWQDGRMTARILVVDDDPAVSEMIGIVLRGDGFEPVFCDHGDRAVEVFRAEQPDVILLDLMLPGKSGIDICREIRAESGVPIVMLTAKSETVDVVLGLESGADDYIPKPFKPRELIARVRARLRRHDTASPGLVRVGDLEIDIVEHRSGFLEVGQKFPLAVRGGGAERVQRGLRHDPRRDRGGRRLGLERAERLVFPGLDIPCRPII